MRPRVTQIFTDFLTAKAPRAPRRTIYRGGCPPWWVNSGTRRVTVIDGFFNHARRPGDSPQGPPLAAVGGNPRPFGVRGQNGRGIAIHAAAHDIFRGESSLNGRGIAIRAAARHAVGGFTLVELLTVLAILVIVAAVAIPSLISLFSGNNLVQAQNQVSSDLAYARNLALQMHTDVALVFYEETSGYAAPVHSGSTAVAFATALPGQPANSTSAIWFEPYSGAAVQYLPHGIYVATLVGTGVAHNVGNGFYLPPSAVTGNAPPYAPRVIVFDPNGHLIVLNELAATPNAHPTAQDTGDWQFSSTGAASSDYGPSAGGFVAYQASALPASATSGVTVSAQLSSLGTYLAANADVQTVNSYTGSVVP